MPAFGFAAIRAGYAFAMTDQPQDPASTATDRLTKEGATPGEDPRDIDAERADAEHVEHAQDHRAIRHADQLEDPETEMGTSSSRDIDAPNPLDTD